MDDQAHAQNSRRLEDLREKLDESQRCDDFERSAKDREEMALLCEELARAAGLGGRSRRAASAVERARVNVTLAIKSALRKIFEENPALGRHLGNAVKTGTFCSYTPDPRSAVEWEF